jgi:hypothetical protein
VTVFWPRLSRKRAFLALLGALPAAHGGLGADSGADRRAGAGSGTVPGAGNRAVDCASVRRHSDDTEAIWSEAPDTAWPRLDSGPFYTFVTIDP